MAGDQSHKKTGGCAGIAKVKHVFRLVERADAASEDLPCAVIQPVHAGAEGAHGGGRREHILAFQQA